MACSALPWTSLCRHHQPCINTGVRESRLKLQLSGLGHMAHKAAASDAYRAPNTLPSIQESSSAFHPGAGPWWGSTRTAYFLDSLAAGAAGFFFPPFWKMGASSLAPPLLPPDGPPLPAPDQARAITQLGRAHVTRQNTGPLVLSSSSACLRLEPVTHPRTRSCSPWMRQAPPSRCSPPSPPPPLPRHCLPRPAPPPSSRLFKQARQTRSTGTSQSGVHSYSWMNKAEPCH